MSDISARRILNVLAVKSDALADRIGAGVVFGKVISTSPLTIDIEGHARLTENFFVLSPFCRKMYGWSSVFYTEGMEHSHYTPKVTTSEAAGHRHTVEPEPLGMSVGGGAHKLPEFTTSSDLGHFHGVDGGDYTDEAEPFGIFLLPPFKEFYEMNFYQMAHFHNFEEMFTTKPARDGHTHTFSFSGGTNQTIVPSALWRGIQEGDIVNMIMASDKQKYYIIERQGMR